MDYTGIMGQWKRMKEKYPDAVVLFRCGDFYEVYEDDAKVCADVLAITLTQRKDGGVRMAGFPHFALDTYLPKLVRAGLRVCICDPMDEPKKKHTSTTKNSTTMANVEINAALVGKVLVMGKSGSTTYTIVSVDADGEVINTIFRRENNPDLPIRMKKDDFEKLLASSNVHWQDESTEDEPKQEQPTTDEDVEEVDAEEVEDEPKQEPVKPKLRVVTGKIVQEKVREQPVEDEEEPTEDETEEEPKAEQTKAEPKRTKRTTAKGKYFIVPYTTKKGKEAVKIAGFSEDDDIRARGGELHAAKTCERIKGKKYYELMFGPRYSEAARAMCDALNAGTDFDELLEIVETNTEALAQKRAEAKAEYFEKKKEREAKRAEREAEKKAEAKSEPKATATKAAAKGEKLYTEAEVKARIRAAFKALADATGGNVADFEPLIEAA